VILELVQYRQTKMRTGSKPPAPMTDNAPFNRSSDRPQRYRLLSPMGAAVDLPAKQSRLPVEIGCYSVIPVDSVLFKMTATYAQD
jgi:hypothetical protein